MDVKTDEKQIRICVVSVEETETQMRETLSMRKIRKIGSKEEGEKVHYLNEIHVLKSCFVS